jgi:molybdopterin-containing oxidoreductase family membrane subunit
VAGAIFGGFAMVLTILLPARLVYPKLDDMITRQHVDKMAKIICSPAASSATPI